MPGVRAILTYFRRYYNKTQFSGLETHIANSYTNPLLQLLRFTPLVRNVALHHTATTCLSDSCLLCEMGFLFDMMEKAEGQSCQATNFLKTFSSIPEGAFPCPWPRRLLILSNSGCPRAPGGKYSSCTPDRDDAGCMSFHAGALRVRLPEDVSQCRRVQ